MGIFNYDTFVDLSLVFSHRRGQLFVRPPEAYTPPSKLQSRFTDLQGFKSALTSRFMPIVLSVPVQPVQVVEEPKAASGAARRVLKLKEAVVLPPVTGLSRNSSGSDLASAFKAEMALLVKKQQAMPDLKQTADELLAGEKRRHPLSQKSWAELIAEAEAPQKPKHNFDLASAFKAEMQALLAEQEKTGEVLPSTKLKTAFRPITSPQPQIMVSLRPRHVAKSRALVA